MFLAFFAGINLVSATTVYVDPSNIADSSLGVGDQFTVDVKIDDVSELYGFDYKLNFDQNILNGVSVVSSFLNENTIELMNSIDNENGNIWFSRSSRFPAAPKSGSGTLATITFQVKGVGESTLDLYNTLLAHADAYPITHETQDGSFNNIPPVTTTIPTTTTTIYRPPQRPRPRGFFDTLSLFFSGLFGF